MKGSGSDWLPVRAPAPYAGEVFAGLAAQAGLALPPAEVVARADGAALAISDSPALDRMLRDMLRYSTNLTAEAVGLRASQARGAAPDGVAASAAAMGGWARQRFGLPARVLRRPFRARRRLAGGAGGDGGGAAAGRRARGAAAGRGR